MAMTPLQENLARIQRDIAAQASAAGRDPQSVTLIAVSKTKPLDLIREAHAAGQMDFGENRVQELVEKHEALPDVRWHMIGVLQRNKVKYIAPFIHLIHSVDSVRLAKEVEKQGAKNERAINILLQINISDEDQKGGLSEDEAESLLQDIAQYPQLRVKGLMGMAEFTDDMDVVRTQFKRLANAAERFRPLENEQVSMQELSMGMSGDYPIAIEEGATMVRVGSAIFGRRHVKL